MAKPRNTALDNALKMYAGIHQNIKDDIGLAIRWAEGALRSHEGDGHIFQICASHVQGQVMCTLSKPSWAGEHFSEPMPSGSEAIVMAVCEYLNDM